MNPNKVIRNSKNNTIKKDSCPFCDFEEVKIENGILHCLRCKTDVEISEIEEMTAKGRPDLIWSVRKKERFFAEVRDHIINRVKYKFGSIKIQW